MEAGLRADPEGPGMAAEKRRGAGRARGLRGTLGSPRKLYPLLCSPSVPAQAQRGENMLETGPPTHVGEPLCSNPAGDKGIIVRPTDTPLSN